MHKYYADILPDIQPGNWLFTIPDLNSLSEEEVTMEVEESKVFIDVHEYGGSLDESAPRYVATCQPIHLGMDLSKGFTVKISDMGGGKLWGLISPGIVY